MPITKDRRNKWATKLINIKQANYEGLIILNKWETEFLQSISKAIKEEKDLTFPQSKKLREIHGRIK